MGDLSKMSSWHSVECDFERFSFSDTCILLMFFLKICTDFLNRCRPFANNCENETIVYNTQFKPYGLANQKSCYIQMLLNKKHLENSTINPFPNDKF